MESFKKKLAVSVVIDCFEEDLRVGAPQRQ
jgi:hypothetical protein